MQPLTTCPGSVPLQQFLQGKASEADAACLEQHLIGCPSCLQLFAEMAAEKAPVSPGQAEPPGHPLIERLLGKVRQPKAPPAPRPSEATRAFSMMNTEPSLMSDANDERLYALGPAQGPDEMGRLASYRVLRILGVGGMGTVYEAEDTVLRRRVALKTMKPAAAAQPGARDRFLREARAAAALSHDHIVPIFQVGEERGVPFLAMPLLHGEMLEDRLNRVGRLPIDEALRIGREIAEGLTAAHDHGIVHRDIKPANIWLESPNSRVKIVDFGLASSQEGDVQLTMPGAILGTPAYMAPEQAGGPIDHRADLFSLGCVLYRMATGRLPFAGATPLEILRNIAVQSPRSPRELNPAIPAALDQFLLRLLAKEREQRPVSAAVTAKVLRTLEQQLAGTIQIPAAKAPLALPAAPGAKPTSPPPLAQWIQSGPNAAPPARVAQPIQSAAPAAVQASRDLQKTPSPTTAGAGASMMLRLTNLQSVLRVPGSRRKLILAGAGIAAVVLIGLLLVIALVWRMGSQPGGNQVAGKNGEPDKDPKIPKGPFQKIIPPPLHIPDVPLAVGEALNPNSIVTRPTKVEHLVTWDVISDHIISYSAPTLSFLPDGRLDIRNGDSHVLWDFEKGSTNTAPFGGSYSALAPDQNSCARILPQSVPIFEKDKTELARSLLTGSVTSVDWSHRGDYLATYGAEGVCIWNPNQARRVSRWADAPPPNGNSGGEFVWAPDDQSVVAWLTGGYPDVYQIDPAMGKALQKISVEGGVRTVRLGPQGQAFAVLCFNDAKIRVYDIKQAKLLYTFRDAANAPPAWSPDGKTLAVGVGDGIQLWNCESWKEVKLLYKLDKHKQPSRAVAFAPHGETLFSYDSDGKLRLWEVQTGKQRGTIVFLEGGHWLAATADGDYRASEGGADAALFRFQAIEKEFTYDLSPKKFADKYKWTNDPDKPLQQLK